MVSAKVKIQNEEGLHLKPAGNLCKEALKFESLIRIKKENRTGNAKSVISVLSTCVRGGDEIQLICEGTDEEEALASLIHLIDTGLMMREEKG